MKCRHLLATATALLLAIPVFAQQPGPPRPVDPNAPRPVQRAERALQRAEDRVDRAQERTAAQRQTVLRPVQPSMSMNTDEMIARCLIHGNYAEVELGKLALEHAQSQKTKQFAEQMVEDHSKALAALAKIAPSTLNNRLEEDVPKLPADIKPAPPSGGAFAPPQPGESTEGRVAATPRAFNFMEIQQRLAEQCLNSTKLSLLEHKGADFDAAYVGTMIVKHQEMLDHQSVLRDYASPEFRKMIEEQMDFTQTHLDHAKQLLRTVSVKAAKEEAPSAAGAIQPSRS